MTRECANQYCRKPISACMGFTFSCDWEDHLAGRRFARELCGLCAALLLIEPSELNEKGRAAQSQVRECMTVARP